ncbi:MAG: type II toxin-antitoxin system RelE/ParE family toxin [Burkholderiaceae bacterium]|nr:type II toxin-antitoxin system RelE/ParE family toxin [Burkholderiaceae bacterium]
MNSWRRRRRCNWRFRHKDLERLFESGSKSGIQAAHAACLRLQLGALDQAVNRSDIPWIS